MGVYCVLRCGPFSFGYLMCDTCYNLLRYTDWPPRSYIKQPNTLLRRGGRPKGGGQRRELHNERLRLWLNNVGFNFCVLVSSCASGRDVKTNETNMLPRDDFAWRKSNAIWGRYAPLQLGINFQHVNFPATSSVVNLIIQVRVTPENGTPENWGWIIGP